MSNLTEEGSASPLIATCALQSRWPMTSDPSKITTEIWVVPLRNKGWGLRLQHEEKPFALFAKRGVAIDHARRLVKDRDIELVILDDESIVETREIVRPRESKPD